MPETQTLVIGAGLAGMTCARRLAGAGHRVTVVDKGRRPSGRLATRTSRSGPVFDHGAQFFTARLDAFQAVIKDWQARGVAAPWDAQIVDLDHGQAAPTQRQATRYVGTPSMDALIADLCQPTAGIDGPHFGLHIAQVTASDRGYTAHTADGPIAGVFDRVVVAIPGVQAHTLLADLHTGFAADLSAAKTQACWAAMLSFEKPLNLGYDAAFVEGGSPLGWIARNTSKPGRPDADSAAGECWVLHGEAKWSQANVELTPGQALPQLVDALAAATGTTVPDPAYAAAHRWRFAHVTQPLDAPFLHDAQRRLSVCGDVFCTGPRPNIEQAWRSGHDLAETILHAG